MTFLLAIISPFTLIWSWFQKLDFSTKVSVLLSIALFVLVSLYGSTRDEKLILQKRLEEVESVYKEKVAVLDEQSKAIKSLDLAQQEQQKQYEASLQKAKKDAAKELSKASQLSVVKPTGDDCKDVAALFDADKRANEK